MNRGAVAGNRRKREGQTVKAWIVATQTTLGDLAGELPFELFLVFAFILLCSLAARRLGQPEVMGCFLGGFLLHLLVGFTDVDMTRHISLDAHTIFLLIGLLIFNEGLNVELSTMKKNGAEIAVLAVVGTVLGACICGGLLRLLFGWQWIVAVIVGIMMVPTDAGAVLAVLSRSGVAERWRSLIAGESIFNDPIGLILFVLATGVWYGQRPNWLETVLVVVGGSTVLGMVLGYLFYRLYRMMSDPVSELILSGMLFVAAYFGAEHFHMSGFLAVAAASIFVGNRKALCMDPETVEDRGPGVGGRGDRRGGFSLRHDRGGHSPGRSLASRRSGVGRHCRGHGGAVVHCTASPVDSGPCLPAGHPLALAYRGGPGRPPRGSDDGDSPQPAQGPARVG